MAIPIAIASNFPGALTPKDFPKGFLFGAASSAFQCEGAPDADGRGPSIWDTFLKKNHKDILDAGVLDVEFYYRYQEDIKTMKNMGFKAFRFSISWPRILPSGRRTKGPNGVEQGVNQLGIDFYKKVIKSLLDNGIEPYVTLFHWDLPQALETEYQGFLSDKSVKDFADYSDLCFREFGDKVKHWITFHETWSYSMNGYLLGTFAPGRGSTDKNQRAAMASVVPSGPGRSREAFKRSPTPRGGNPETEPYIVTHNQLLAHAAAVKLFRQKYQNTQKGKIGFGLVTISTEPRTNTKEDKDAAQRVIDSMLGWLLDPVVFGKYPESMRRLVGDRLPQFTREQAKDLIGSFDFIWLNYYTANSVSKSKAVIYNPDSQAICHNLGQEAGSSRVDIYSEGFEKVLLYIKEKYKNPILYIIENGIDEKSDGNLSKRESLHDEHYKQHVEAMRKAIKKGANIKGYFTWSFTDSVEWIEGFNSRFGLNYLHCGRALEWYPE